MLATYLYHDPRHHFKMPQAYHRHYIGLNDKGMREREREKEKPLMALCNKRTAAIKSQLC